MPEVEEFRFQYFADFIGKFAEILFPVDGVFVRGRYVFRGHGSETYHLRSSFDRYYKDKTPYQRVQLYESLLKYIAEEFKDSEESTDTELETTGIAQHYGIPTRLLDWSSSPLIAAYFAFHERVMKPADDDYVSIWALCREDTSVWTRRNGVEVVRFESRNNDRAKRQLGYATSITTPDEGIEEVVFRLKPNKTVLWKFNIHVADSRGAFAFLDSCNVRAATLFGHNEGAARTAFERLNLG